MYTLAFYIQVRVLGLYIVTKKRIAMYHNYFFSITIFCHGIILS